MGWAGRNGNHAHAILYHKAIGNDVTKQAKFYRENIIVCCRELLFKDFLFFYKESGLSGCKYWDLCTIWCTCEDCGVL